MCAYCPLPDGQRSRKETFVLSSFPLRSTNKQCRCRYGHQELRGTDDNNGSPRTAQAALYHWKFCLSLCEDMLAHTGKTVYETSSSATAYSPEGQEIRDMDDEEHKAIVPPIGPSYDESQGHGSQIS